MLLQRMMLSLCLKTYQSCILILTLLIAKIGRNVTSELFIYRILFFNETFLNMFSIQSMLSNSRKEWKLQMLCCLFNQLFSRFLCDITMPWNFSHGITWWHSLSFYVCSLWVAFTPPPPKPSWLIVLLAFTPFGLENEALFYFSGAWTMRSLMKLQLQLEEV